MKPLIVHNIAGEERRLNPVQIVGWAETEIKMPDDRYLVGTLVAMGAGPPVEIRESVAQLDWMFEQATGQAPTTWSEPAEPPAG